MWRIVFAAKWQCFVSVSKFKCYFLPLWFPKLNEHFFFITSWLQCAIRIICMPALYSQWKFWDVECTHGDNSLHHHETPGSSRTHCSACVGTIYYNRLWMRDALMPRMSQYFNWVAYFFWFEYHMLNVLIE